MADTVTFSCKLQAENRTLVYSMYCLDTPMHSFEDVISKTG